MNVISVNQFRDNLRSYVDEVINNHIPLKVTRRNGDDFMIISVEDWERQQETLYILQNSNLIKQINESQITHQENKGYEPSIGEINEIINF
ncbi:type II toxin-antitoxin system Phd/YefM family antitoxin [Geminocystis sp. CENA526]|uniref:type II toxin-antitoxin system Phd/YefM family antitoxin n=1 Tax=Geminocystis sp. CENA526 TaxID=1355871 RepID=UPI003D6DD3D1